MAKTRKKQNRAAASKGKATMTNAMSIHKKKISNKDKTNSKKNKKTVNNVSVLAKNKNIKNIKNINKKRITRTINTSNTLQNNTTEKQLQITNNNKSKKRRASKNKVKLTQVNNSNDNSVKKVQKLKKTIDKKNKIVRKVNSVNQVVGSVNKNTIKIDKIPKINIERLKEMVATKEKDEKKISKKVKEVLPLRERMMTKLKASRFRFLNETLYKNSSTQSKKYFKEDPEAFTAYHEGYKYQVTQWPLNPLNVIIESIKNMPNNHVIADFGCGEALLASSVPQKVHSFDFISMNEKVQACDMAHTPLLANSVHVVVFCLSLMGTNLGDYIREANRVLKKDGMLKIAEIESRFDKIEDFIKSISEYGFVNTWKDLSQNLFYFLDFKKIKDITTSRNKFPEITLKSCVYKKR